jgi:Domain of unknown function DUF29
MLGKDLVQMRFGFRVYYPVRMHGRLQPWIAPTGPAAHSAAMDDYRTDTAAWAIQQAELLRNRTSNALDWDNLAGEIEDLASRYRDEIENRLIVVLAHLLKLAHLADPDPQRGWRVTIIEQRRRIARVISRNPSLRDYPAAVLAEAYDDARAAVAEYADDLPETCPWAISQLLDADYWP